MKSKLRVPIVFGPKVKVIGEFNYNNERLHVNGFPDLADPTSINLQKAGVALYAEKKLSQDRFWISHWQGNLRSNELNFNDFSSKLNFSGSFLVGKNLSPRTKVAVGMVAGNNLGRVVVSPALMYQHHFNDRLAMEVLLPKHVRLRQYLNQRSYVYASLEASASNYYIANSTLEGLDQLEFRRSSVDLRLGLDREIKDWVWFGVSGGVTRPVNSFLVNPGARSRDSVFDFEPSFSPFMNVSLFLVPSRKMCQKHGINY